MAFNIKNLTGLIMAGVKNNASDIHIRSRETPFLRIRGDLVPIQSREITRQDIIDICTIILKDQKLKKSFDDINEYDGGFSIPELCRVRYNFFRFRKKLGLTFRIIPLEIPTIEELNLPPINSKIAEQKRGLILVTGTTGSGKSTTLAAMINRINKHYPKHIITIEDPIEFVHPQLKSRVTQREVGKDTDSFGDALRASLRQDPDIILIGEMRDKETISTALQASETGHLVISTMHTTDSTSTVGRIISLFPPEEQENIRERIAVNLHATISQRILKRRSKGLVVAQEIMVTNEGIRECILENNLGRLKTMIAKAKTPGGNSCQTFDQHLMDLLESKAITEETALEAASSEADFIQKRFLEGE